MLKYLFRRILIFIPTLLAISLIAFWLSKMAPQKLPVPDEPGFELALESMAKRMGLDKPVFYINFTSAAYPDTLYEIKKRYKRDNLKKLIAQYGNWPEIDNYYQSIRSLQYRLHEVPDSVARDRVINIERAINLLFLNFKDNLINGQIEKIKSNAFPIAGASNDQLKLSIETQVLDLENAYAAVKEKATPSLLYIPTIHWHGFDNQYHNWVTAFLRGDFGISYRDNQPVVQRLKTPLFWTLIMNLVAITIAFLISIPIGVYSAMKRYTAFDKITTVSLFILYSLPTFWIGTLLVVFFTNSEYGMDWFCGIGLGNAPSNAPFWDRFWETACHLVLPIFCLTYTALAFISRQMRGSMLNTIQQDYIRTAKAKGLSNNSIIWKHAFRNALFPLITMIALVFPATISGSVVIEVIFNIPGMGREVYNAIFAQDWIIVYTVLMLVAILTMFGNLFADVLYAIADPRISYRKS